MARNRTPTAIHEQSGAFEHDPARGRDRALEPRPTGPLGDPPAEFDAERYEDADAKSFARLCAAVWRELADQAAPGVLTVADRILVEMACRDIARMRLGVSLKAAEKNFIKSALSLMGMTPADRSRVSVPAPTNEDDPFERIAQRQRTGGDVQPIRPGADDDKREP